MRVAIVAAERSVMNTFSWQLLDVARTAAMALVIWSAAATAGTARCAMGLVRADINGLRFALRCPQPPDVTAALVARFYVAFHECVVAGVHVHVRG